MRNAAISKALKTAVAAVAVFVCGTAHAQLLEPEAQAFSFQAHLTGVSDGAHTLHISLYDAETGGSQQGPTIDVAADVVNGIVSEQVSLPDVTVFDGGLRLWAEVAVDADPPLAPRIPLIAVPYAFRVHQVSSLELDDDLELGDLNSSGSLLLHDGLGTPTIMLLGNAGGSPSIDVSGLVQMTGFKLTTTPSDGYVLTCDPNGVGTWQPAPGGSSVWSADGDDIFNNNVGNVGIGTPTPGELLDVNGTIQVVGFKLTSAPQAGHVLTADADGVGTWQELPAAGSSWSLTGNAGTDPNSNYLGTTDDVALVLRVNGQPALRLEPYLSAPNLIGGSSANSVEDGAGGATIAGGGHPAGANCVADSYGTIAGGLSNLAGSDDGDPNDAMFASVGGGQDNQALADYATVAGGQSNHALADYASIGGGGPWDLGNPDTANRVYDNYGTIAGGGGNRAGDPNDADPTGQQYATVGGGRRNEASYSYDIVGGGYYNKTSGGAATVGGGYSNEAVNAYATVAGGYNNHATAEHTTVGGGSGNLATVEYATVAGGKTNRALADYAAIAGGVNNEATGPFGTVAGGAGNIASAADEGWGHATVGGGWVNTASGMFATVGGGRHNEALADYGTIGGGGTSNPDDFTSANYVYDNYGTIGGGGANEAGSDDGDPNDAIYATVGGGGDNEALADYATVGGGHTNEASGDYATVGGGYNNKASGACATIPGGISNQAGGDYSFAGGYMAKVRDPDEAGDPNGPGDQGTFVWSDVSDPYNPFTSTGPNQFLIRAAGGVGINTNDPNSPLTVAGMIESTADGFKFPDGSVQTTAATGGDDAWSLTGNAGTDPYTHFLGTTDDVALVLRVNDRQALRVEPHWGADYGDSTNLIGDASNNAAIGVEASVVLGGSFYYPNVVYDDFSTVAGGLANEAGSDDGDPYAGHGATVGGGAMNRAMGTYATVGGGSANTASGDYPTVGGGSYNRALADYATVPGGRNNRAGGTCSFAGGYYAKVRDPDEAGDPNGPGDEGTFVWSDVGDPNNPFTSIGSSQFLIRAAGGVGIGTNDPRGMLTVNGANALEIERDLDYPDTRARIGISSFGGGPPGLRFNMSADDGANYVDALFVSETGGVGIGTAYPMADVHILDTSSNARICVESSSPTYGDGDADVDFQGPIGQRYVVGWDDDLGIFRIYSGTQNANVFIIEESTGQVGINTSDAEYPVHIVGQTRIDGELLVRDVPHGNRLNAQWDDVTKRFYHDSSSRRFKENICPLKGDFGMLLKAGPMTYTRPGAPDVWEIGYIAEDFHELGLTPLVHYDGEGLPYAINYEKTCLYLAQIAREQQLKIDTLARQMVEKDTEVTALTKLTTDQQQQLESQQQQLSDLTARLAALESLVRANHGDGVRR